MKFMLSGGQDGVLIIWRVKDWEPMHSFKAHQASVVDIGVHPSGRMALSIGRDNQLRLWDLMNGSCAVTKKMDCPMEMVAWAPTTGTRFAILADNKFLVADLIAADTQFREWEKVSGVTCFHFASDQCLILGTNKGEVVVYNVSPEVGYQELHRHKGHPTRIKGIFSAGEGCFASMGSDGSICVWTYQQKVSDDEESEVDFEGPLEKEHMQLALQVEGPSHNGEAVARITSVCSNGYNWTPPISFQTTSTNDKETSSTSTSSKKDLKKAAKLTRQQEEEAEQLQTSEDELDDEEVFAEEMSEGEIQEALQRDGKADIETKKVQTPKALSKKQKLLKKKKIKAQKNKTPVKKSNKQKMHKTEAVFKKKMAGKLAKKKKKVA